MRNPHPTPLDIKYHVLNALYEAFGNDNFAGYVTAKRAVQAGIAAAEKEKRNETA